MSKLKTKENFFVRASNVSIENTEATKKKYITGVIPYNKRSCNLGGFFEEITPSAFSKTISDKKNVVLLYNHDDSKVLGSTRSGTLQLESRDDGLYFSCEVNEEVGFARDAYSIINRGDCNTLSFGFRPIKTENRNGIRYLKEVALDEISCCVAWPAYEDGYTNTQFRSYMMKNEINFELIEEALNNAESLSEAQKAEVQNLIASLQSMIEDKPAEEAEVKEEITAEEKPADEDKTEETVEEAVAEEANSEPSDDTQNPPEANTEDTEKTVEEPKAEEAEVVDMENDERLKEESEKMAELLHLIDLELAK